MLRFFENFDLGETVSKRKKHGHFLIFFEIYKILKILIFSHKVWNCCPERYGKFQSEIPNTSGAISEKPQGGPLPPPPPPPPSGARVNIFFFNLVRMFAWADSRDQSLH